MHNEIKAWMLTCRLSWNEIQAGWPWWLVGYRYATHINILSDDWKFNMLRSPYAS